VQILYETIPDFIQISLPYMSKRLQRLKIKAMLQSVFSLVPSEEAFINTRCAINGFFTRGFQNDDQSLLSNRVYLQTGGVSVRSQTTKTLAICADPELTTSFIISNSG